MLFLRLVVAFLCWLSFYCYWPPWGEDETWVFYWWAHNASWYVIWMSMRWKMRDDNCWGCTCWPVTWWREPSHNCSWISCYATPSRIRSTSLNRSINTQLHLWPFYRLSKRVLDMVEILFDYVERVLSLWFFSSFIKSVSTKETLQHPTMVLLLIQEWYQDIPFDPLWVGRYVAC